VVLCYTNPHKLIQKDVEDGEELSDNSAGLTTIKGEREKERELRAPPERL
jgi:hypothetical protein